MCDVTLQESREHELRPSADGAAARPGRVSRLPPANRIRELCTPEDELGAWGRRRGDVRPDRPGGGVAGQDKRGNKTGNNSHDPSRVHSSAARRSPGHRQSSGSIIFQRDYGVQAKFRPGRGLHGSRQTGPQESGRPRNWHRNLAGVSLARRAAARAIGLADADRRRAIGQFCEHRAHFCRVSQSWNSRNSWSVCADETFGAVSFTKRLKSVS